MPHIEARCVRRGEARPWQEDTPSGYRYVHHGAPLEVAFIEDGMSNGAPSVAVRVLLADGTFLVVETSLGLWINATSAARGWFPEAFAGGALAGP